jgi:hypothetical protein
LERNFDVTTGRAACEASNATWNLSNNSAFTLGTRKITEKLYRVRLAKFYINNVSKINSCPSENSTILRSRGNFLHALFNAAASTPDAGIITE